MKAIKFVILFCLICSTGSLSFALYAEKGWLRSQKSALAVSSTTTAVDEVKQRFISLDEKMKLKFVDDFLENLGHRDKTISSSVNSSFEMTQTATYAVLAFNSLAAICTIFLLVKNSRLQTKLESEK